MSNGQRWDPPSLVGVLHDVEVTDPQTGDVTIEQRPYVRGDWVKCCCGRRERVGQMRPIPPSYRVTIQARLRRCRDGDPTWACQPCWKAMWRTGRIPKQAYYVQLGAPGWLIAKIARDGAWPKG